MKHYLGSIKAVCDQWFNGLITEKEAWMSILAQMYMATIEMYTKGDDDAK